MIKKNTQKSQTDKLLKMPEVIDEINRHLWIESEKAGYDIGFERASQDWIERYAAAWMEYHMPSQLQKREIALRKGRKVSKKV